MNIQCIAVSIWMQLYFQPVQPCGCWCAPIVIWLLSRLASQQSAPGLAMAANETIRFYLCITAIMYISMCPCHCWNLRFIIRCGTWLGLILCFMSIFLWSMLIWLVYSIWMVKWRKLTEAVDNHTYIAQSSGFINHKQLKHHQYLWWNEVVQQRRLMVDDDSSL